MFSGLVECQAKLLELVPEPAGVRLVASRPEQFDDVILGASISINGCCLTVVDLNESSMAFQAGEETLSKTTIGQLQPNDPINVERALALGDRLGGHLVSGHVDGVGTVARREDEEEWSTIRFACAPALLRQMAPKGSITVQGVSLTLVDVTQEEFSVALIPHTLSETTLGRLQVGDLVNLETDMLAKYVQRQLEAFNLSPQDSTQ